MLRDFSKEEYDIIIQAGQSNAEGSGMGRVAEPFQPSDSILYLNGDFTICTALERVCGNETLSDFSLSFCASYIKSGLLQTGRKLLIVRSSVGGTGFLDHRWGLTDDLYLRMMDMIRTALELNPKNRLVAFLWHQGETDAILNATRQGHYNNLSTLLATVRKTLNTQTLPFVAGDFVKNWKAENIAVCEPVIAAMKDVCLDAGCARFVETSELPCNDDAIGNQDGIHFSRKGLYLLGVKYFDAFRDIMGLKKAD